MFQGNWRLEAGRNKKYTFFLRFGAKEVSKTKTERGVDEINFKVLFENHGVAVSFIDY